MKLLRSFCLILIGIFALSVRAENVSFSQQLIDSIRSCIESSQEMIPKEEMAALLDRLVSDGEAIEQGNDDLRVKFVTLQGYIEHVLACFQALGEIDLLAGVIHTPMPPTPLCASPESDVSELLDASIRSDPHKLLTVLSRAQIVREYLMKGGRLYAVYPKDGLQKRTSAQQKIYRDTLGAFPDRLIDQELVLAEIAPGMIGATYLFRCKDDSRLFAFSIKARQASDIEPHAEWGLWFGQAENPAVALRINTIFDYFSQAGATDLRKEISLPTQLLC